jgi:hypothetical protein
MLALMDVHGNLAMTYGAHDPGVPFSWHARPKRDDAPLAEKYSLANYLIPAKIMQGWVRVLRGEVEDGVQQAETALETLKFFPSRRAVEAGQSRKCHSQKHLI